jgi:glyoxylate utilization-related uncharacterized protein
LGVGLVLHQHTSVNEAFYVVAGHLEAQLDDQRVQAAAGGFVWVPRGTAHTFANAGPQPVKVLALAVPGGVEELFAQQAAYLAAVQGPPDPQVLYTAIEQVFDSIQSCGTLILLRRRTGDQEVRAR